MCLIKSITSSAWSLSIRQGLGHRNRPSSFILSQPTPAPLPTLHPSSAKLDFAFTPFLSEGFGPTDRTVSHFNMEGSGFNDASFDIPSGPSLGGVWPLAAYKLRSRCACTTLDAVAYRVNK
jgi:hypothetical protein